MSRDWALDGWFFDESTSEAPTPKPEAPTPKNVSAKKIIDESMKLLEDSHGHLISRAREEAILLAKASGTVHSRMVRARMKALNLLPPDGKEYWLGTVFRDPRFEWTGELHTYSDPDRKVFDRNVKVWRLKD